MKFYVMPLKFLVQRDNQVTLHRSKAFILLELLLFFQKFELIKLNFFGFEITYFFKYYYSNLLIFRNSIFVTLSFQN